MTEAHEIYIGDKVERAVEIIGEENGDYELISKYADDEIRPTVELRGNYLYVEVDDV